MKILLLGKDGQLGWELRRALAPLGEVIAMGRGPESGAGVDLADAGVLRSAVRTIAPHVIVNAAAYTAVDQAESNPAMAHAVNAVAPGLLAQQAAAAGAWLMHFSTDYVFDGAGTRPWTEDSPTNPLNVYGQSKIAGEQAIRAAGCRHLILRTSWLHSARGGNFAKTMLRLAQERERLAVVADQYGAPTGAELLAGVAALALHDVQRRPELGGTYHVAAAGQTSWHGYACHVIDRARRKGLPIRVEPGQIEPVSSEAFPLPARRPHNSRLDTTRLCATFGLSMPDWHVGVDRMLDELLDR